MSGPNINGSPYSQKPQASPYSLNSQQSDSRKFNGIAVSPQYSYGNVQSPIPFSQEQTGLPSSLPQKILPSQMTPSKPVDVNVPFSQNGSANLPPKAPMAPHQVTASKPIEAAAKPFVSKTPINGQNGPHNYVGCQYKPPNYAVTSQPNPMNQVNYNLNVNSNMNMPLLPNRNMTQNSFPSQQGGFNNMQNNFQSMTVNSLAATRPQTNYTVKSVSLFSKLVSGNNLVEVDHKMPDCQIPMVSPSNSATHSSKSQQPVLNSMGPSIPTNSSAVNHKVTYATVTPRFVPPPPGGAPTAQYPPNVSANLPNSKPPNADMPSVNGPRFANRYPAMLGQNMVGSTYYPQPSQPFNQNSVPTQPTYSQSNSIINSGFSQSWNKQHVDLLQTPNVLPPTTIEPPKVNLGDENLSNLNCSSDIVRCTLTKIPDNSSLLQKSRLPLGILIHPFRDLSYLPVIQCNVIVRCRSCRTYINPFVYFVDSKRWKCNICYRVNELPEEFQYDPVSKTYGDPSRRPEIRSSTIEYIAPAEYMLRPPQPAIYIFLLDISRLAVESGYLNVLCSVLTEELQNLPGDGRTQIGLLGYDSALHFYLLSEGLSQPQEMIVLDVDDAFLPAPDGLLVNLRGRMDMILDMLEQLPEKYKNTFDTNSALGAALQVAHKMISSTGGRITVFQASLPNVGPGALTSRENPNQRASSDVAFLNPANDFYKRLALECSSQQIAVDLFVLNSQYVDLATISGISRFSGGCMHHFPMFKSQNMQITAFTNSLRRYLLRKIGFEAVMRVRCTRGLAVHTFHGNFFVRSTDLLSLPNINPDSAFGLQIAIEESLSDVQTVCFQAALLYTSSKAERRIRVHTICLPVVSSLNDVIHSADQQAIIGLLAKMAVDRSMQSSLSDAREAFINVAVDILSAYKVSNNTGSPTELLVPECLKLLPLYISAILKHPAFSVGVAVRLDDRLKAMIDMKTLPLYLLIQFIYPDLYPIHNLEQYVHESSEGDIVIRPPKLHLSSRCLDSKGAFLLDCGDHMLIWIANSATPEVLQIFGASSFDLIPIPMTEVPELDCLSNQRLRRFICCLNDEKPYPATVQVVRDDKPERVMFLEKLVEDRLENSMSYHEFLQHLKMQIK